MTSRPTMRLALLGLLTLFFLPVRASAQTDDVTLGDGPVERVLVFSVPTLSWADLADFEAPAIEGFVDESAIGALSVRGVDRRTTSADGYAMLSAGTRARGVASADLSFNVGEEYEETPAAEEFARRTGIIPSPSSVLSFGVVGNVQANARLHYDAEIGALADALAANDYTTAAIANGDHFEGELLRYRRAAATGLMNSDGLVDTGVVDGEVLLERDVDSPYETRLDIDEVVSAFDDTWQERSVVLVEASDFVRYEDFRTLATPEQRLKLQQQTLTRSDELFRRLLDQVDPETDAVVLVAPYHASSGTHLTTLAIRAPGVEAGLLSSGTTRRAGFVTLVDVAPTILDLTGTDLPTSMEGTPSDRAAGGGDAADRRQFLIDSNEGALFRDSLVGPASRNFVIAQIVLWVLALIAMARANRRFAHVIEVAALALLGFLPATYLAGLLPFSDYGSLAYWAFTIVVATGLAAVAQLAGRRNVVDPLIIMLSTIIGLLTLDIVTGGHLQLNTVFGYTPTIAGRFAGFGNPTFAMFSAATIMLAGLLAHRIGGRRGAWVAVALLGAAVVVDGSPIWGADVGGVLAFVPAAGVTAWMLLGYKIRLRTAVIWGAAAVAAVVAFGLVDLQRPVDERTHLGRLFADIGANGYDAFETVVIRKLDANFAVLTTSVWTLMLPVVFAFVGYVFWRAPWRLERIQQSIPQERAALAGLITAMVLGFALNDSGIAVPGMMLGVVNASLVHLVLRIDRVEPGATAGSDEQAPDVEERAPDDEPAVLSRP